MSLNVSCPSHAYNLADKMNLTFREGTSFKKKEEEEEMSEKTAHDKYLGNPESV